MANLNTIIEYTLYPQGGKRETITQTLGEIIEETMKYSINQLFCLIEKMENGGRIPEEFDHDYFNVEALAPALTIEDIADLVEAHPRHMRILEEG